MKEYGGYIEFEHFNGKIYHENAVALNSGRHCVEYLICAKQIKKIYLPYFLCASVKNVCDKLEVQVEYYHTDTKFMPKCDRYFKDQEWLYLVNYYGQISNETLVKLKNQYGNVIVDNVQAFFQIPVDGIDTLYSCRKFFGVADGGYLYTDSLLGWELERDCSFDRMKFLFGRMEKTANEFYLQYVENNKLFATVPMKRMSRTTENILQGLDYHRIKDKRTENFHYIDEQLHSFNKLTLTVPEGAFMYPLYLKNGAGIRKKLQEEKIYVPVLWPDVLKNCKENELEYDMALNILPIPIDQRYGKNDMDFLTNRILYHISKETLKGEERKADTLYDI